MDRGGATTGNGEGHAQGDTTTVQEATTCSSQDSMSIALDWLKFMGAAIVTLVFQSLLALKNISDPIRYVLATSVCFLSIFTFSSMMKKYMRRGDNMGEILFCSRFVLNGEEFWLKPYAIEIAEAVFISSHFVVSIINVFSIPRSMTFALGVGITLASVIVTTAFIDCLAPGEDFIIIRCRGNERYKFKAHYYQGEKECDCRHCYPPSAG